MKFIIAVTLSLHCSFAFAELQFIGAKDGLINADEGHTILKWEGSKTVGLYQSTDIDFSNERLIYEGDEQGYYISGLKDGDHFFKILSGSGETAMVRVSVKYPDKNLVIFSLITGTILLISLVTIVFLGNKKYANATA